MGGVLRIPQVVQREVGRDDQRLTAAVTAVYHIENLFQPVLGAALHAEVVKDQQRIAAKTGNVLVVPLKTSGKVIEDKGKVRHVDRDFFLHEGVCDTARKVAFPGSHAAREEREAAEKRRRHLDTVEELKRRGFTDPTMRDWTFENDNGRNPQAGIARRYVEHWEDMRTDNIGCLFWGGVGTGKSYLAGCIANALMEKEIPVHMTNFALILNDLAASFENRNEYISRLCRYPLLILDDFGMERGTEYGLEQVFNVIDSRYRSGKPLIVTTNLTLDDLRNPEDTAHSRIYDRLLSMCVPVRFTGDNFRQEAAQRKMESMKKLITD